MTFSMQMPAAPTTASDNSVILRAVYEPTNSLVVEGEPPTMLIKFHTDTRISYTHKLCQVTIRTGIIEATMAISV